MSWDEYTLNEIYDKTDGRCHICRKKLSFINYGRLGQKGAWEVEHSNPRAEGGTDHLNNLYPACITCNRNKGTRSSRGVRADHGYQRAPLSRKRQQEKRQQSAIAWAAGLGTAGLFFGAKGAFVGAVVGALIGLNQDPEDEC